MEKKKLTWLILIVLFTVTAIAFYGYTEYNRKNISLATKAADFNVSSAELVQEFSANEKKATEKYSGKIVHIEGVVKSMEKDEKGFYTIVIGDGESLSSIRCSMDTSYVPDSRLQLEHPKVNLKGICTGYLADEMGLGADIILNRCIFIQK
jgi:uncharacterized protein (DUF1330 family)